MVIRCALLALLLACSTALEAAEWRNQWNGTLYGYGTRTWLNSASRLNPGNGLARLAEQSGRGELRFNLRGGNDWLRIDLRPIAFVSDSRNAFGATRQNDLYLARGQARLRLGRHVTLAGGREVMNWGPSQLRSPASPFYFDSGRSDPMRELNGMDLAKLVWTPDMSSSVTVAHIFANGDKGVTVDGWKDSWLGKFDYRGDDWSAGVVAAKPRRAAPFFGMHLQQAAGDAWLLYGETSYGALAGITSSARRLTALTGAAYTLESGHTLYGEYLHDGHGFSSSMQQHYFALAAVAPGAALASMPRLMGRNYLHLVWQSNLMDEDGFWRLMATHNLDDHSSRIAAYGELALAGRYSLFATGYYNGGSANREAAALLRGGLSAGVKVALP